jgi:NO-binding membrane sensor protein with MHYT domain
MLLALVKNPVTLVVGGVVTASGVCVMHYLGLQAVVLDAVIVWNSGIVAASVIIAIVAATAAYWILFRLLALYPQVEALRLLSSIVAAVAV